MSELIQQMLQNGQELQTGDVNNLGQAALMDDRLLADVLRMLPNTGSISRLIMPYGVDNDINSTTVQPSGSADGKVIIAPFRAVVGSRTNSSTDGLKSWRDIRSGVFVAGAGVWSAVPTTGLSVSQSFTANASGNARWDLVYAVVTPDANQPGVNRAVKSPTTGTVTTGATVTQLACTVSIAVVTGTPAASPALPSIPADGGGIYYIPLAYVMIPNNFGGSSTIKTWHVMPAAPTPIALSKGLGGANAMPANQQGSALGTNVTATRVASWANNSTASISARPTAFMPSDMIGSEDLWIALDMSGGTTSNWSHQSGTVVDNSRDWRNRIFYGHWVAGAPTSNPGGFPWSRVSGSAPSFLTPQRQMTVYSTFGQSFADDSSGLVGGATNGLILNVSPTQLTNMAVSSQVALYVDTSGVLRVWMAATSPNCCMFGWIRSSRPYGDY